VNLSETDGKPPRPTDRRARKRAPVGDVGQALRSAYDDALKEAIPPEMLDLLGKLG
jgi:predicted trehalose synthase